MTGLLALMLALGVPLDKTEQCFAYFAQEPEPMYFSDAVTLARRIVAWNNNGRKGPPREPDPKYVKQLA